MSRCFICGTSYTYPEVGVSECALCKPIREMFGDKFGAVMGWVLAVAENAAGDAVLGHENDVDHSS